jgi:CheY-like chemotaxis protein
VGKRILVVDDSDDIRHFFSFVLEDAGDTVVVAESGEQALELARSERPDLVLTDVVMPGMSGLDLVTALRSDLAPPLPPIIVCSGFPDTEQAALARGATLVLPKPVAPPDLTSIVAVVLAGRVPQRSAIEQIRRHASERRRLVSAAAEPLVEQVLASVPDTHVRLERGMKWLASYFGFGAALLVRVRGQGLHVLAASDPLQLPPDYRVDEMLPQCLDIVETDSSLLIPDVSAHPSFSTLLNEPHAVRFFAGVPIRLPDGSRVGALCLVDRQPHSAGADDLAILEYMGRAATVDLRHGAMRCEMVRPESALLSLPFFLFLLAVELRAAHVVGDAVELAVLDLDAQVADRACTKAVNAAVDLQRFGIGQLGAKQIALFKRTTSSTAAADVINEAVRAIRAVQPIRAVGIMSLLNAPSVNAEEFLRLAKEAANVATAADNGGIARFVLRREPWQSVQQSRLPLKEPAAVTPPATTRLPVGRDRA